MLASVCQLSQITVRIHEAVAVVNTLTDIIETSPFTTHYPAGLIFVLSTEHTLSALRLKT